MYLAWTLCPPFQPFKPLLFLDGDHKCLAAGVTSLSNERKAAHCCKVNRISLIKFLLPANEWHELLVYTVPSSSTNRGYIRLFGLVWDYARRCRCFVHSTSRVSLRNKIKEEWTKKISEMDSIRTTRRFFKTRHRNSLTKRTMKSRDILNSVLPATVSMNSWRQTRE